MTAARHPRNRVKPEPTHLLHRGANCGARRRLDHNTYVYGPPATSSNKPCSGPGPRSTCTPTRPDPPDSSAARPGSDAYGNLLSHTGTATSPFGYVGQYTDPTGLIYLRDRYYDQTTE
jgi:hypothetical protein